MKYYHVAQNRWDGRDLESLASRMGDEGEAIDAYAARWPDAAELAQYHVHYVHLHATEAEARAYVTGGEILEIDDPDGDLGVKVDTLEYPHPVVRDSIPSQYVRRVAVVG